jgi:hypothetical protein
MVCMTIHSRLKHFKLVDRITQVSAEGILGEADFDGMPAFGGLEAMAQLAALHVRHNFDFERHAFLLKVNHGRWPARDDLQGHFHLSADLYSQSSNAFAYHVKAQGPGEGDLCADLLIGTKPYDGEFKEYMLKAYYRRIFRKLRADGEKK